MSELWAYIDGYNGIYQVSNFGNVRKLKRWHSGKQSYIECKPHKIAKTGNGNGYLIVGLCMFGKRQNFYVHRLVADAFIERIDGKNYINHIDYNRSNNNASNLEWCTQKENVLYSSWKMKKRRPSKSNTGERYISYRKCKDEYRVTINRKEYAPQKTLRDAIDLRNRILEEEYGEKI